MACFVVPAAEAIVTTVAARVMKAREKEETKASSVSEGTAEMRKLPFSEKLGWLNKMLWGGSALLAFEHVWHGEVIPVFPFLTAVENGEAAEMLAEMGSTGVMMAVFVTVAWAGMLFVSSVIEKREIRAKKLVKEGI